jgi:hypothetical protein
VYRKRADGSGEAERISDPEAFANPYPNSYSPDGRWLLVSVTGDGGNDLWAIPADGEGDALAFMTTQFAEISGAFSPDGKWVAYETNESGRLEVYVSSFPPGGGKWQISDEGGSQSLWSKDGRKLYYRTNEGVMFVDVLDGGDSFRAGRPQPAITGSYIGGVNGVQAGAYFFGDYDVFSDGSFVLFEGDTAVEGVTTAKLVTGWFSELDRLTSATGK